jgi:hypothetical protein
MPLDQLLRDAFTAGNSIAAACIKRQMWDWILLLNIVLPLLCFCCSLHSVVCRAA